MTGPTDAVPALLAVLAVAALVPAVLLSAGEAAVPRLGRSGMAELAVVESRHGRRVNRILADAHGAVAAAAWSRVGLEAVAVVALTLALAWSGLAWWPTLLVAAGAAVVLGLLVVRYLPRSIARRHPRGAVRVAAGPLLAARSLTRPVRRLALGASPVPDRSAEELRDMVDRFDESQSIEEEDRALVRSVLELGDTRVRSVMVPRTEMIVLPSGTTVRKALSLFLRSGYSRVPVVGESVDDLVGILYLKDLLRHRHMTGRDVDDEPVEPLVRPPVFVPESKAVDDLLREMQSASSHIAMVVDEYGGVAGLVTIEDALEEIVGELTDEHDRSGPEVEDLGGGTYRVPSRLPVDELGELFDLELTDDEVDTAGGLLAKALGKVPLADSSAAVSGLVITAERVQGRRRQVATLLVRRAQDDDDRATTDQGERR
ncbi:hemolysin family protein [Actinotalea sp. Marseille-Q4924]|uniref:hemolysin family protein n=1 Tax=Actinotalea sp. Marseille-Q4924 TaxID=2866571 RepID=UPI001CE4B35E|nr:hemolysin family protein [Actinotalea sp. Marseille-Q4924]